MLIGAYFVYSVALVTGSTAQMSRTEQVEVRCPLVLGVGINNEVPFCDIQVQRDADLGILVILPPHRGEATLSFNLHNRHTYSEQETLRGRAYVQYIASIAVATRKGEIISRGVVLSEFRTAADLVDRVSGGAGPGGVKAIAPTGSERIFVTVPAGIDEVSIVGQSLEVVRVDSRDTFRSLGRPIAIMSDASISYRPR